MNGLMVRKFAKRRLVYAWMAAVLLVGVIARASEGHHDAPASFGNVNWWTWSPHQPPMGWFLLDFVLFVAGLVYFTAKPLSDAFSQRHSAIKRSIAEMASAHAKASSKQQLLRSQLAGLEGEVKSLLDSNQKDGSAEREQFVKDAKSYADRIGKDASSIAEQESARARDRLQRGVLRAALTRAEKLLREQIKPEDQQNLIEQAIKELESGRALDSLKKNKAGLTLVQGGAA